MRFTQEQKMQMVHARALLLSKMRTILNERHNLVAAAGVRPSFAPPMSQTVEPVLPCWVQARGGTSAMKQLVSCVHL